MEEELRVDGKEAILIAGPTASGKSRLAVRLARAHGGEIVNADSMQVYDVLRVLTARPSEAEMADVPHHLYGHVPPQEDYSTGRWLADAEAAIADIRGRGRLPVLVGGTGLYFRAITGGLSDIPPVPAEIRARWRRELSERGALAIHAELAKRDPEMANRLSEGDAQRVLRAVEIFDATGKSLAVFQKPSGRQVVDPETTLMIALLPERQALYDRIDRRFASMVGAGALDEVKSLLQHAIPPDKPVMKAIGVRALAEVLAGRRPIEEAIAAASTATRQYAKRQMTWLRNQHDQRWLKLSRFG